MVTSWGAREASLKPDSSRSANALVFGLERIAKKNRVERAVIFYNRFVSLEELVEFIGAADIYITPYLNPAQIVSGTLAYTVGAGKAVISTPYWHAEEMLAEERGALIPFRDPAAFEVLENEEAGLAIDRAGIVYVSGNTSSADFPISADAVQTTYRGGTGNTDAFASFLSPDLSRLLFSTYLGGSGTTGGFGDRGADLPHRAVCPCDSVGGSQNSIAAWAATAGRSEMEAMVGGPFGSNVGAVYSLTAAE